MIPSEDKFNGTYGELCLRFIAHKRSLGYAYTERQCYAVKYLNDYLSQSTSTTIRLSKELVEGFIKKKNGEAPKSQAKRVFMVRQFGLFLITLGYEVFLPPYQKIKINKSFTPYIFTKEEIDLIIKASEEIRPMNRGPNACLVYPMLMRLLFGCGLRISEALRLTAADVNLDEGILVVRQSKFNNSRLVPMSDSLLEYCRRYCRNMNFVFNSEKPEYLFPVARGKPYGSRGIYGRFRYFLKQAGIAYGGRGQGPRLHDARHTFAVHALEQMVQNGLDIYCALPVLSTYMGHRTMESTEQYVRLVPSAHMDIINAITAVRLIDEI